MTAARALAMTALPGRLNAAEFARATVRAARNGSANTSLMVSSSGQSGSFSAI